MKISPKISYQKKYYDKRHEYMDSGDTNYINKIVDELVRDGGIKKYHKILEIGCGKGRFSIPLLKKGYSLTCIDLSDNLLKEFKRNVSGKMRIKIMGGDFNRIYRKMKGKFDFIIGFYILHHLEDLEKSFKNMNTMLKKGGKIIFSENNPYNLMYYIQMLIVKDMDWRGERGILNMRKNIIFPLLKKTGFRNYFIKRHGFFPPQIINTKIGLKLDKTLSKIKAFYPFLPYQIIAAKKLK